MRKRLAILFVLPILACASTPEPEPALPGGVVVVPHEKGRLFGGRATYVVDVPLARMEEVVLDFDSQAAYRPMVVEARSLTAGPKGGTVFYRFRGSLGVEPRATCVYAVEDEGETWTLTFRMTDSSMTLRALEGSFSLRSVDGGKKTLVEQTFLVSAIVMNRESLLEELRTDAEAIRAHAEAARGE